MSKYTTGEIAKLCNVTVRTVQYYDGRGILTPSELSEGGRRLYSDEDLKRLRTICFLREAGLSIGSISVLFEQKHPEKIISTLLEQQEQSLKEELSEKEKNLALIEGIKSELKGTTNFSLESIGDIAYVMKNKNKLTKLHAILLLTGIPISALQCVSIILWIISGIWWLFPIWCAVAAIYGVFASVYYFKHVEYICPECHAVFRPKFKQMFFAKHTPKLRYLTCTACGYKGYCVETYKKETETNGNN